MPHFRIETNLPRNKIPQDFVSTATPVLAKALGKPEQYCVVSVIPDVIMSFGGSTAPCAIANLMSIGALGVEQNKKHSKVLFELVTKELGIPNDSDRRGLVVKMRNNIREKMVISVIKLMYITFQDEPTGNVGFQGTTFHSIMG